MREELFSCKVYFSSPSWQLKDKTLKSLQFQHAKQSFNKKTKEKDPKENKKGKHPIETSKPYQSAFSFFKVTNTREIQRTINI